MAFIDSKDSVVLNIKLTSKGRELLSNGNFNFKYYTIGDSEIDYSFNANVLQYDSNYSAFNASILRPADKNPNLLSFIPQALSGDPYNVISTVPSIPTIIQNTTSPLGFFTIAPSSTNFITDSDHVKQPDIMVRISEVTGGTNLKLHKSPTYLANANNPIVGDLLLVKWTNPYGINTTGYSVNINYPTPYLVYKILKIVSGSLKSNNLIVGVDRNLPDFSNLTGGNNNIVAGAMVYYDYINYAGSSIINNYSTDYVDEAVITFLQNCQCPAIKFPFWNMSIIYTDNIIGIQNTDRSYAQYKTKQYGGFVSYIQNQIPAIKKLGVIHYTNSSPSNVYAEEFYHNTPKLELPTIMWHKAQSNTLGATFTAYGSIKTTGSVIINNENLTGGTRSLNTTYYDLADSSGNVVGKVFINLKLFVIEDQELLFAMSYKSNRSWTLPNYSVGINDRTTIGCLPCNLTYNTTSIPPSVINGIDGKIGITDITGNYGDMVFEILSGSTRLCYLPLSAGTTIYTYNNLKIGNYTVNLYDLGGQNCIIPSYAAVSNPVSLLKLYEVETTGSGLNPDFTITQINPTNIIIYASSVGQNYGTLYGAIMPYGVLPSSGDWVAFGGSPSNVSFNNTIIFGGQYTIYVRDYISGSTEFIVSKNYVAAGTPFKNDFTTFIGTDSNGEYIKINSFLTTIQPNSNPIIGTIEASVCLPSTVPTIWVANTANNIIKIYPEKQNATAYTVSIRERMGSIEMYRIIKFISSIQTTIQATTTIQNG